MHESIDDFTRRTQRYWYVDGLAEIAGGSIILLLGLFYLAMDLMPSSPIKPWLLLLGQPVLIIGGAVAARKIVAHFKERLTYPRTGYVAYKRRKGSRRVIMFVFTALFAASLALMLALAESFMSENMLPIISSTLVALFTLYLAYQFGLKRFYIISVITFLLGLVIAWIGRPDPFTTIVFFSSLGLIWMISGIWVLVQYLQKTGAQAGEGA